MGHDPIVGPVSGPVNKKTDKDRNGPPGATRGGIPANDARTRSPGKPTAGGNRPPKKLAKPPAKRKPVKDDIPVPVLRPVQAFR